MRNHVRESGTGYRALAACCLLVSWTGGAARADAPTETGAFDSRGVPIRYVTAGEGEPVVLIHGWMADATMWGRSPAGEPRLEPPPGFRLIALDCRGHGRSGKPHDPALYGPEMASDVVRLMDRLGLAKAHLVGYSMGAFIVGRVVAARPERVLSATYAGQVPLVAGAPSSGSREVAVFAKAVEEGTGLGAWLLEVTPPGRPRPKPEVADALAAMLVRGKDTKALAAAGLSFDALQVEEKELVAASVPTLFVYGSLEPDFLKSRVDALRKALPRAEVREIEGGDHVTTLAKPAFKEALLDFLRRNRLEPLPARGGSGAPSRPTGEPGLFSQ